MPWLEKLWIKNTTVNRMLPARTAPVISFALARAAERVGEEGKFTGEEPSHLINSRDFLSRFLEAKQKDPTIPDWFLTAWTTSNILAGSDTTAISLRSIIYYVLKHPRSLEKLTNELRQAKQEGRLSATVTWKEAQNLEYLDACIKEAGRLHPATGLVLERVVPSGGMNICGKHFKAGTVVGMNAWVVHRDKDVFGEDAFEWSPERWLGDKSRRQAMERSLLTVSYFPCTCEKLLNDSIVRTWPPILHWEEHLSPRDLQVDTDSFCTISGSCTLHTTFDLTALNLTYAANRCSLQSRQKTGE